MSLQSIEHLSVDALQPYSRNARTHSAKQIAQIAASIRTFGFNNPVLIDKDGGIKLRKPLPRTVREITRIIDKTPLRRQEVEDRRIRN